MDRMKDDYKDILDFQFDKKNQIAFTTVQSCVYTDHRKPESLDGVWGFTPDVFRSVTRKNLFSASGKDEQGREVPMDWMTGIGCMRGRRFIPGPLSIQRKRKGNGSYFGSGQPTMSAGSG